jgi:hypothetical protein
MHVYDKSLAPLSEMHEKSVALYTVFPFEVAKNKGFLADVR